VKKSGADRSGEGPAYRRAVQRSKLAGIRESTLIFVKFPRKCKHFQHFKISDLYKALANRRR